MSRNFINNSIHFAWPSANYYFRPSSHVPAGVTNGHIGNYSKSIYRHGWSDYRTRSSKKPSHYGRRAKTRS